MTCVKTLSSGKFWTLTNPFYRDDEEQFNMPEPAIENWPGYIEPFRKLNHFEEEKIDRNRIFSEVRLNLIDLFQVSHLPKKLTNPKKGVTP